MGVDTIISYTIRGEMSSKGKFPEKLTGCNKPTRITIAGKAGMFFRNAKKSAIRFLRHPPSHLNK